MSIWGVLLAVSWGLSTARWRYLRSQGVDPALNVHGLCQVIGCTLLSPPAGLVFPRAWAISLALVIAATGLQVVGIFSTHVARRQTPWRRKLANLAWVSAGIVPLAMIMLSYPAWRHGNTPFEQTGPEMLGYWLCYVIPLWLYIPLLLESIHAERRAELPRVFYASTLGIGVAGLAMGGLLLANATLLAAGDRTRLAEWTLLVYPYYFLCVTVSSSAFYTVPLQRQLAQRLGLDRWSRRRRRLVPLWNDLTAACPEIVHLVARTPATIDARYRLHRIIIEIRDSMLILSRYTTPVPSEVTAALAVGTHDDDVLLAQAIRLARAVAAKKRGEKPDHNLAGQRSAALDLLTDTDELIRFALLWPRAKVFAALDRNARSSLSRVRSR